jgi:class 3 adenylate cyclase
VLANFFERVREISDRHGGTVEKFIGDVVRKHLVRPDRPQVKQQEAHRFWHVLLRDAAYDACVESFSARAI